MKLTNIPRLGLPALTLILLGAAACNQNSDPTVESYGDDTSVAVTAFSLKIPASGNTRTDSIAFAIDLVNGVIFNADSLPKGTDVTGLVPIIKYPTSVSKAVITMNGEKRQGEVNYLEHPTDTVDFTGDVALTLTAQDKQTSRSYRIKVNVHKLDSDTLMWDDMSSAKLPSRLANPVGQKSVSRDSRIWCLIEENDGSLTLANSDAPGSKGWSKATPTLPDNVIIRSFTATDDAFYILDTDGSLLTSDDGAQWTATGQKWLSITGGYGKAVLGIDSSEGTLRHVSYPALYAPMEVASDFPVGGISNMGLMHTKWSLTPIALVAGGYDADGNTLATVWGFDGLSWARISQHGTPALAEATLIPYTYFRPNSTGNGTTEYSVWLLTGGVGSDGELNRTVYMSYDNGVNWQQAVDYMQLPESISSFKEGDAVVLYERRQVSLTDYWTKMPSRKLSPWMIKYEQDGYDLSWEVPYIYLMGGYGINNRLNDICWRGVLNRLTFTPLI